MICDGLLEQLRTIVLHSGDWDTLYYTQVVTEFGLATGVLRSSDSMKKLSSRFLRYEALEARQLFAADVALPHNFVMPEDCDNSGNVSPLDALVVINQLNHSPSRETTMMLDVNADGNLSPLDALVVINHLNSKSPDGAPTVSAIAPEARIARLEKAMAALTLPPNMTLADAQEVLDTLKSGRHPELGERVIAGKLHSKTEVTKIENEKAANDLTLPLSDDDKASKLQVFVDRFASRLKAAGVDAQVITTVADEVKAGFEANKPLTLAQIKTRLTELGVDLTKLFPVIDKEPVSPVQDRIQHLVNQLNKAGVKAEVVTTIVNEIQSSVVAGSPLTIDQIKARLVELGVDVSKSFPTVTPATQNGSLGVQRLPVQLVVNVLQLAKVSTDAIEIVRKAMNDANSLGTPLTITQVLKLLSDNGVTIPEWIGRLLRR